MTRTRLAGDERRSWSSVWAGLAIVAVIAAVALAVIVFLTDDIEARQFEAAMDAVAEGVPEGVILSGTVAHTVTDGDDTVLGYVVNGMRGDQEVLCRAVLATNSVECTDLPVNWLAILDDADWK